MEIQYPPDVSLIVHCPRHESDAGLAAVVHHSLVHNHEFRAEPFRREIQFPHIGIPVCILLAYKVGKLYLRILLVHIVQSPGIETLDYQSVAEVLGQKQFHTFVHKLMILRPVLAFVLALPALDLDIVPHRVQTVGLHVILYRIDQLSSERLDGRRLLLARPDSAWTFAYIVFGDGAVRHRVEIFLRILALHLASVRAGSIAGMEICIVRNDHLSVLTDLKVQLESIHAHLSSLGHGRERVFRPETSTSAVSLDVHIVAQFHVEFPLLAETAADIDSHHLGVLVRSCGEIMDILLRLLE